jgi:hypothetical protein
VRRATWGRCVSGRCCGVRESSSQPLTPKGTAPLLHCPDPRKARATFHGACPRRTRMAMPVAPYIDVGGTGRLRRVTDRAGSVTTPPGAEPPHPRRDHRSATDRRPGDPPPGSHTASTPARPPRPAPFGGGRVDTGPPVGIRLPPRAPRHSVRSAVRPAQGAQRSDPPSGLCAGPMTESRMHNQLFSANFIPLSLPCRIGRSTPLPPGRKRPRGTLPPGGDGPSRRGALPCTAAE